jgi:hypothetical protein
MPFNPVHTSLAVPFATFVSTVATLHSDNRILSNKVSFSSLEPSHPALNHCSARALVENAICFQRVMRGLSHKDLGETELDISLWESHGNRLPLHSTNLLESVDARFFWIERALIGMFLALLETGCQ